MGIFQYRWLRKLIRRHTNPMPVQRAQQWKNRLSIAYAIIAWNALGMVCYMVYTGRNDWAKYYGYKTEEDEKMGPGANWAKHLKIEKAKVIRYSGFQRVSEKDIDNTKPEEKVSAENILQ